MNRLKSMLTRWLSSLSCPGFVNHPAQRTAVSTDVEATGCLGIDGNDLRHLSYLVCTRGRDQCEACPRFKAFWQRPLGQPTVEEGGMLAGRQVKTDAGHGDREATQVDDRDQKALWSIGKEPPGRRYSNLHPVVRPSSPGVDQPKSCAKQCDAERHGLQGRFIHGARIVAAGSTRVWLTALLITLWMGAIAALSDEPTEFDAMVATAAAARDVEREGAPLSDGAR